MPLPEAAPAPLSGSRRVNVPLKSNVPFES